MSNNNTNTQERAHHPYSPSSLESLEACPCFINRQSKTPHERTIAGTKAHAVVDSKTDDATLSDEDAENAAACLDLVAKRKQAMEEDFQRYLKESKLDSPGITVSGPLEIREGYWPVDSELFDDPTPPLDGSTDAWKQGSQRVVATTAGYADTVLVSHCRTKAEVLDWKFGRWKVTEARTNLQGVAYALGVFHAYPTVQEVRVTFVQPLLESQTEWVFKREDVAALYLRVQTVVARAREARRTGDFTAANPCVPVCNFCGNLGKCPKVAAFACEVGKKFYPLDIPDNITPTMIHDPHNTNLAMRLASVVKVWAEAFRTQVTDRVLARRADMPEGFRIETKQSREIVDMAKLKEVALKHLTPEEFEKTLTTTFGALEDLISEKAPRGLKKAAIQGFKEELEKEVAVRRGEAYSFLKAIPASKK